METVFDNELNVPGCNIMLNCQHTDGMLRNYDISFVFLSSFMIVCDAVNQNENAFEQ